MARFLLLIHGGRAPTTPADQYRTMGDWTAWYVSLGMALVDPGLPSQRTRRIGPDGIDSEDAAGPSGYAIISARSLDCAVELARGCPALQRGATVQVVESFEAM